MELERHFAPERSPRGFEYTPSSVTFEQARESMRALLPPDARLVELRRQSTVLSGELYFSEALQGTGTSGRIGIAYLQNREPGNVVTALMGIE